MTALAYVSRRSGHNHVTEFDPRFSAEPTARDCGRVGIRSAASPSTRRAIGWCGSHSRISAAPSAAKQRDRNHAESRRVERSKPLRPRCRSRASLLRAAAVPKAHTARPQQSFVDGSSTHCLVNDIRFRTAPSGTWESWTKRMARWASISVPREAPPSRTAKINKRALSSVQ
ncbi:MAG: hypothetical protein EBY80_09965 [Actinobacteria bacterium]|nr:hypothetical protein [Actinomycetota bacterium]